MHRSLTIEPVDTRLKDIAQSILDVVAAELAEESIDVPERQYIHAGSIAHDLAGEKCGEALIVSWSGLNQGSVRAGGGGQPNFPVRCSMPTIATFTIVLLRCVPTISEVLIAPKMTALQSSGESILEDAMTLTKIVIEKSLSKELTGMGCVLTGIGNVVPVGPFGAIGGTALTLTTDVVGMTN